MIFLGVFFLLACTCSAKDFTCPEDKPSFYYADVSSGCRVYHFCENSELQTLTCPDDQAFHYLTSKCENASTVPCHEILNLGKHTSTDLALVDEGRVRSKRDLMELIDMFHDLAAPVIKPLIRAGAIMFFGDDNTITSKVIIPTLFEMCDYAPSRHDMWDIFFSAKDAFLPIKNEMIEQGGLHYASRGTVVAIPKEHFERAMHLLITETTPIIIRLASNHLTGAISRAYENLGVIFDSLHSLNAAKYQHAPELIEEVTEFVRKHKDVLSTSSSTHINFYAIPEIISDLMPIKDSLLKIFIQYLSDRPNSIVNVLYGKSSISEPPSYRQQSYTQRPSFGPTPYWQNPSYKKFPSRQQSSSRQHPSRQQPSWLQPSWRQPGKRQPGPFTRMTQRYNRG